MGLEADLIPSFPSLYEGSYYARTFGNFRIVHRDTVKAPDAEAMKKELAFALLSPVNDADEGVCLWIPYGRAKKIGDHLEHTIILVKASKDIPAIEHMQHLVYSVIHCGDGL